MEPAELAMAAFMRISYLYFNLFLIFIIKYLKIQCIEINYL